MQLRCSQCQALAINGVACHEQGCPNQEFDGVKDSWIKAWSTGESSEPLLIPVADKAEYVSEDDLLDKEGRMPEVRIMSKSDIESTYTDLEEDDEDREYYLVDECVYFLD